MVLRVQKIFVKIVLYCKMNYILKMYKKKKYYKKQISPIFKNVYFLLCVVRWVNLIDLNPDVLVKF